MRRRAPDAALWAPALLAAATFAAFGPILRNGFVWDDAPMIVKGLRIPGGFMPLGWATLGLLRRAFGPSPAPFHAANLVVHWLVCVAVWLFARLFFARVPAYPRPQRAALGAALLYCVHPLQTASVAWAADLPDLLAVLFAVLALAAYLSRGRARLPVCLALYAVSLLFRWTALALPVALLALDWWPLRRRAIAEKWPFFALGLLTAAVTASGETRAAHALAIMPYAICRGLCLFPLKLLWPVDVLPVYGLHGASDTLGLPGPAAAALTLGAAGWLWAGRRRRPALVVAGLFYAAVLLPPLLAPQFGMLFVLPKYAYLCCLPAFFLVSDGLNRLEARRGAALGLALALTWTLAARVATRAWSDSITFWTRAIALDPGCRVAYGNLGGALIDAGRLDDAYAVLSAQLAYNPKDEVARANMDVLSALLAKPRSKAGP